MFSTVRYFIKTSIIFLVIGIFSGLFMIISRRIYGLGYGASLISAHTHIILVGFMLMMIMGVALWFFPRAEKTDKKYNPILILIAYFIITISTSLRFVFEFIDAYYSSKFFDYIITISTILQVISIAIYFYSMWGRIRPVGSQYREAKGERF